MYACFKLEKLLFKFNASLTTRIFRHKKQTIIKEKLKNYVIDSDTVNATEVQKDWFPEVSADIFISHSHADIKQVTKIADFLYEKLGLICFIDSYAWGYFNDLTNLLLEGESLTLENVSYVSSNVHMMLSMALSNMIDKCECLIFYNTPNSLPINSYFHKTTSPWIYNELVISKIIRRKSKAEHRMLLENFSKTASIVNKKFYYDVDMSHLNNITVKNFKSWIQYCPKKYNALDKLYKMYNL